jgi:hypothetical protein
MSLSDSRSRCRPSDGIGRRNLPRDRVSPDDSCCLVGVPCPLPRRNQTGAHVRFPSPFGTAFPVAQAGRLPHRYFRGLLRLYSRYGPPTRSAALRRPLSQGFSPHDCSHKLPVRYSIKPATTDVESSSTGNTPRRGTLRKIALRRARYQTKPADEISCGLSEL